jgi:hypothetical protein
MPMDEDDVWRKRLLIYTLVRFVGILIFLFGVATVYTGVVRPGGWPQLGAVVAILGVVVSFFAPRLIKRGWERDESGKP